MGDGPLPEADALPDLAVWVEERQSILRAGYLFRLGVGRDFEVQLPTHLPPGPWASVRHACYWVIRPEAGTELWLDDDSLPADRGTPVNERPGMRELRLRREGAETSIRICAPTPTPVMMDPLPRWDPVPGPAPFSTPLRSRTMPDAGCKPSVPTPPVPPPEQLTQPLPPPAATVRLPVGTPSPSLQGQGLVVRNLGDFARLMDEHGWLGGIGLRPSRRRFGGRREAVVIRRVLRSKERTIDVSPGPDGRPFGVAATATVSELMTDDAGMYPVDLWDEGWAVTRDRRILMWQKRCRHHAAFVYAPLPAKTDLGDSSPTPPPGIWENPANLTPEQLAQELTRALRRLLA
jgi:hypothetical protein